jgi:hypothetical protein
VRESIPTCPLFSSRAANFSLLVRPRQPVSNRRKLASSVIFGTRGRVPGGVGFATCDQTATLPKTPYIQALRRSEVARTRQNEHCAMLRLLLSERRSPRGKGRAEALQDKLRAARPVTERILPSRAMRTVRRIRTPAPTPKNSPENICAGPSREVSGTIYRRKPRRPLPKLSSR